jgi:hypothetical protein
MSSLLSYAAKQGASPITSFPMHAFRARRSRLMPCTASSLGSLNKLHVHQRSSTFYQSSHTDPFSFVLVGGGPRGAMCLNAFVATMLAHDQDVDMLQRMGARYDIKINMIESQGKSELARGNSFGSEHTGISNTGVNWKLTPRLAASADEKSSSISSMGDIASKVRRSVSNHGATEAQMKSTNRVAAIMFQKATSAASTTPHGQVSLDTACLQRKDVGESLLATFKEFYGAAKQKMPYLQLNVQTNTKVQCLQLERGSDLAVSTFNKRTGRTELIKADTVHLFTGSTLKAPDVQPPVRSMTYCGFMTPANLWGFLTPQGLLDEDKKLKVGSKILIGGTNLSAIDAMTAMEPYMGLVEECPSEPGGYRINATAARDYADAITFVSYEPCMFPIPRVSFGQGWRQTSDAFGSTEQMHALFLHEHGQDLGNVWTVIQKAAIARTNGILPSQVDPHFTSTKEQLAFMYQSSLVYFENMEKAGLAEKVYGSNSTEKKSYLDKATQSLYGARMQAACNRSDGYGMERDLEAARQRMAELAPLTWGGRHGWPMEKAQLAAITNPEFAAESSNEDLYRDWVKQDWDMIGSPPAMHSLIVKLCEAGVVKFVTAKYADIAAAPSHDKLSLLGDTYDVFLVSPVFDRSADVTAKALLGQVTPVHAELATHSLVGKHRAVISKDGTMLNVEDYGMSGCGAKIHHKDGSRSHLNAYAVDLNSLASAVDTMPSVAMRMATAAHLHAAGVDDPWSVVRALFHQCTPSVAAYNAEVSKFAPMFQEAHEMAVYFKLLERTCDGDATVFATGYDASGTKAGRSAFLETLCGTNNSIAKAEYDEQISNIPLFNPASKDGYFARFVDTTEKEDIMVYERAVELSKEHLFARASEAATPVIQYQPQQLVAM